MQKFEKLKLPCGNFICDYDSSGMDYIKNFDSDMQMISISIVWVIVR